MTESERQHILKEAAIDHLFDLMSDTSDGGGIMKNEPVRIELYKKSKGWVAKIEGFEYHKFEPRPTAYEALQDAANYIRELYEAFAFLREGS